NIHEDILWYQTYASERAGNTGYNLAWLVPLNHVAFQVSTQFLDARDRPGFEIDARSQHTDATFKGAAELRMFARTYVGVRGSQQRVAFDSGAPFLGANLRNELNRTITEGAATLRHQLTPLTSISVDVGRIQDRFAYSPLRDANSTTFGVEVQLDPAA